MFNHLKEKMQAHLGGLLMLSIFNIATAGDVKIVAAEFSDQGDSQWSVSVTLKHDDTGWDHYADDWRVVDEEGNVLGDRVLHHPHENEQPFTRSLSRVKVPEGVTKVFIEAHDKLHGWTEKRLMVNLEKVKDGTLKVLLEEDESGGSKEQSEEKEGTVVE